MSTRALSKLCVVSGPHWSAPIRAGASLVCVESHDNHVACAGQLLVSVVLCVAHAGQSDVVRVDR